MVIGAQVDRYKSLLVKQRDIMTGLTGRLNERDEQILRLQEELEAYDSHQKCEKPVQLGSCFVLCAHGPRTLFLHVPASVPCCHGYLSSNLSCHLGC